MGKIIVTPVTNFRVVMDLTLREVELLKGMTQNPFEPAINADGIEHHELSALRHLIFNALLNIGDVIK